MFGFKKKAQKRSIYASLISRLTSDWIGTDSINADIREGLATTRKRSREAATNNPYLRRYLRLCRANIVGANGIRLSVRGIDANGQLDKFANDALQAEWKEWKKRPTMHGGISLEEFEKQVIESVARDGDGFVELVTDPVRGLVLNYLPGDRLDENYDEGSIYGGVEYEGETIVAYHMFSIDTTDPDAMRVNPDVRRRRIPAEDLIPLVDRDSPTQVRGLPWATSVLLDLHHLLKMTESTVVSARVAAARGSYLIPGSEAEEFTGEEVDGATVRDIEPGSTEILPRGWSVHDVDRGKQADTLPTVQKAILRSVASGLSVSYHSLASDYESANFSSARQELITEREMWMDKQSWFIRSFMVPVWERWLSVILMGNSVPMGPKKFDKFKNPVFTGRRWGWVDPLKDTQAAQAALDLKVKSRSMIASENGVDFEQVAQEIAQENEMLEGMGLNEVQTDE